MCDAAGCPKTTPGGGLCNQCQTERKWEQGDRHTLDGDYSPECFNCGSVVENIEYHPTKPGAVLCEDCHREVNEGRDALADGGVTPATTTVELLTERGKHTVEIERATLATDAATIDQARKRADVEADEFNGGQIR